MAAEEKMKQGTYPPQPPIASPTKAKIAAAAAVAVSSEARLEVFNLLNHPNWDIANSTPRSGSFGQITNNE
jgi:hypothetical protein